MFAFDCVRVVYILGVCIGFLCSSVTMDTATSCTEWELVVQVICLEDEGSDASYASPNYPVVCMHSRDEAMPSCLSACVSAKQILNKQGNHRRYTQCKTMNFQTFLYLIQVEAVLLAIISATS